MSDSSLWEETDFGFGDGQADNPSLTWKAPIPNAGSFDAERFLALHFAEDVSLSNIAGNPAPAWIIPEWADLLLEPSYEAGLLNSISTEDATSITHAFISGEETGISPYLLHLSWTDLGGKYDPLMVALG